MNWIPEIFFESKVKVILSVGIDCIKIYLNIDIDKAKKKYTIASTFDSISKKLHALVLCPVWNDDLHDTRKLKIVRVKFKIKLPYLRLWKMLFHQWELSAAAEYHSSRPAGTREQKITKDVHPILQQNCKNTPEKNRS